MQPWEFGSVPRAWIEPLKAQVDELWAYSNYVRDCYIKSGMAADRVHIVPLGVEVPLFETRREPWPLRTKKRFKFLFVGGTIHRKGIDVLLRAYTESFRDSDDVCLVIKDMGVGLFYRGLTAEALIAEHQVKDAAEIEYLPDELYGEEMARLYQACDCLVHPFRGEGFGLPIAEAMASGLPVIVTGHGAALDYCDESRAFLLPARLGFFKEKRLDNLETVDVPWLAEPDGAMLQYYMRYVVEHPEEARAKAEAGAAFIKKEFSWEKAVDTALTRLKELRRRPVRRFQAASAVAAPPIGTKDNGQVRPRVSLTMIVRNEEANLEACLRSVSDLVDERIVVDTGSTDRTKEVALRCGAKVFDFPWCDDFAAARNESLRHATGQWILWLDADEELDEPNRERLRQLLGSLRQENVGYLMRQFSLLQSSNHAAAQVDHLRLFPNRPDLRWQYRIHEQILTPLRRVGGNVCRTDIVIRHKGFHDPAQQTPKIERNWRLLQMALAEDRQDSFVLYNLGAVAVTQTRYEEGLDYLRRAKANTKPPDPMLRKVYAFMARAYQQLGELSNALAVCREGRAVFPGDAELLFHEASVLHEQKQWAGAEACLLELLRAGPGPHLMSSDAGLHGYRTRHFLAEIYRDQGRLEEAETQWRAAVADCPAFAPGWLALARLSLYQNRWLEAEFAANHVERDPQLALEGTLQRGRALLGHKQFAAAQQCFRQVIQQLPQAALPHVYLSHALLQEGKDWAGAEKALRDVLALEPKNQEALNNLQVLLNTQDKQVNGTLAAANAVPQRVSLCMIVRNEEHNLPACLESVVDLVEEIVIVDTGSTDATKVVAARFGAKVFDFPWIDNFAAARNESLRHATCPWILWLDADDRLDEENRGKIRTLLASLKDDNSAYIMKCRCLPDSSGVETVVDHLRLFRNRPDVRWMFRVHEQILPAVKASGAERRRADVTIHHTGYQDASLRNRKLQRDLRLLRLEQAEQPDHAFTLFNLGQIYKELDQPREALEALTRSLKLSAPSDSIVRKLYAMITQCKLMLGDRAGALATCREGRRLFPDDVEILFQEGAAQRNKGDMEGAIKCWEGCLQLPPGDHFASINPGLRGHLTRHNLGLVFWELNRLQEAETQWRAALKERPFYEPAWRGLMGLLVKQERWPELEVLAGELQPGRNGMLVANCIRSRCFLGRRQFAAARELVEQTIESCPEAVEPRVLLSYVFLQEGEDWEAAEQALNSVLELAPDHSEAKHNLAMLRQQQNCPKQILSVAGNAAR
jgi:glycosyltransferase involved in cell wall biosynthesis/Flp pilus assembly protein TadD